MSKVQDVEIPDLGTATLKVEADDRVSLSGTIASQNPAELLAPCLKAIHAAVLEGGGAELKVDVTGLTFVNSSSIRLFIDWAMWIQAAGEGKGYVLRFVTHPDITWQQTSFAALKSIVGDIVAIQEQAD